MSENGALASRSRGLSSPPRAAPASALTHGVPSENNAGVAYAVDVGRCYWNSRLGPERARLVAQWGADDVVLDLCAGVGPIAVAAARRGVAQARLFSLDETGLAAPTHPQQQPCACACPCETWGRLR